MTSAYLEFVKELFKCLNNLKDNKILIHKLNTAYLEIATIKAFEKSIPTKKQSTTTLSYGRKDINFIKPAREFL